MAGRSAGEKVPLNPVADDLDQKELVPESFRTETSTILPARKKATQSVMDALMALDRLDFSDPRTTIPLTVGLCLNNFGGASHFLGEVGTGVRNRRLYQEIIIVLILHCSFDFWVQMILGSPVPHRVWSLRIQF